MPSWLSFCSSLFLSTSGYSTTQWRSFSGLSLLNTRTQRVLSSSVLCMHTDSMPSWKSIPSSERLAVLSPLSCASIHLLNALLAELLRILSDFGLPSNSQQSSSFVHSLHWLDAHLAELLTESSMILSSFKLSTEFFLQHLVHMLNAHLAELLQNPQ
jgi:hypothetical protein